MLPLPLLQEGLQEAHAILHELNALAGGEEGGGPGAAAASAGSSRARGTEAGSKGNGEASVSSDEGEVRLHVTCSLLESCCCDKPPPEHT